MMSYNHLFRLRSRSKVGTRYDLSHDQASTIMIAENVNIIISQFKKPVIQSTDEKNYKKQENSPVFKLGVHVRRAQHVP